MKNTNLAILPGAIIFAYVIYKAVTDNDQAMAEFFAALAVFLGLAGLRYLQRA